MLATDTHGPGETEVGHAARHLWLASTSRPSNVALLIADDLSEAKVYFMSKSVKAALLSAFVFPGIGHFYLKKRISGTVLAGAAVASLFFVISKSLESALQIAEQIQTGGGPRDIAEISRLLAEQSAGSESKSFNIASAVFVVSWLVGIFDSYRKGRVMSKNEPENS